MAQINVTNLTFGYDGSFDYIFENVSFSVDTDWKLGFIGRNGKGKTTFLHLLLGKYEYTGSILTNVVFDYFPYEVASEDLGKSADELMDMWKPGVESWWENKQRADAFSKAENDKHLKEIGKLKTAADRAARWADKNEGTKIGFDPVNMRFETALIIRCSSLF